MVELDMSAGPGQFGGALFSINGSVVGVMFITATHNMRTRILYGLFMQSALDRKVYDPIVFEAIHLFFDPFDVLTVFEVLAERQESAREGERAKDEEEIDSA
ncbi:hypothetical protein RHGRI_032088 [Rhododendron griersonianum]|uniref:Uncharacterized protein n=1 Tax=Rhododendron griersonianum TaxID=479676 RepID=A0AAV6IDK8_9ERIC|nr:hypothetical protein RHGRI_032088 [Rhododendron griersonianum]